MIVQILLSAEKVDRSDIVLPFHYQAPLQGAIYHLNQNAAFGTFLHDVGYSAEGRKYRLFCFSRILENPKYILRQKHAFVFPPKISWIVATVDNPFADSLLQTLFTDDPFMIAGQQLRFCKFFRNAKIIHFMSEQCLRFVFIARLRWQMEKNERFFTIRKKRSLLRYCREISRENA